MYTFLKGNSNIADNEVLDLIRTSLMEHDLEGQLEEVDYDLNQIYSLEDMFDIVEEEDLSEVSYLGYNVLSNYLRERNYLYNPAIGRMFTIDDTKLSWEVFREKSKVVEYVKTKSGLTPMGKSLGSTFSFVHNNLNQSAALHLYESYLKGKEG